MVSRAGSEPETPGPRITLSPDTDRKPVARDEIHGVVLGSKGKPAAGVRVDLTPLFEDENAKKHSTETDDKGRFTFADVAVTPGTPFVADARFDDARFPSGVLRAPTEAGEPVRIVVAETTKNARDVAFGVESVALVGDEKGIQAVHAVTVRNKGDRAFVGTLRLPLLDGANAIDPAQGLDRRDLELDDGELLSRTPIAPGRHDITYTYVASTPRDGLDVIHRVLYPTERFELLVGGELEAARFEGVAEAGDVRISERDYTRYEAHDLEPRAAIELLVTVKGGSALLRNAGMGAAATAAVAILAFPLVRRSRRRAQLDPVTAE